MMPGFFSWKLHRGAKRPTSDPNVGPPDPCPTLSGGGGRRIDLLNRLNHVWDSSSSDRPKSTSSARIVRFCDDDCDEEQSIGGPNHVATKSSIDQPTSNHQQWNYPKPVIVVNDNGPASIDRGKSSETTTTAIRGPRSLGAAATILQSLREDDDPGIMSEAETSSTGKWAVGGRSTTRITPTTTTAGTRPNGLTTNPIVPGLVFLQFEDEVKRSLLPPQLHNLSEVKALFLRAFPQQLTHAYLDQAHVKIYIQESADKGGNGQLFYELDDLRDVKDRAVLKIREHSGYCSPAPSAHRLLVDAPPPPSHHNHHHHHDDNNYYSESELDGGVGAVDYRKRNGPLNSSMMASASYRRLAANSPPTYHYGGQQPRSASTVPMSTTAPLDSSRHRMYGLAATTTTGQLPPPPPKPLRSPSCTFPAIGAGGHTSPPPPMFTSRAPPFSASTVDRYYDSYSSSDSSQRSGSATPIIDREARSRMQDMERQLAGLSSLVHTALMSKGASDTVHRDIASLRKEILGSGTADDNDSVSRFSDISSDKASIDKASPTDGQLPLSTDNVQLRHQLHSVKRRIGDLQSELVHLRRMAQVNAQSSREILVTSFDKIRTMLASNKQSHELSPLHTSSHSGEQQQSDERTAVDREKTEHVHNLEQLERGLTEFEHNIENVRHSLIESNRKMRMSEVEALTNALTGLGRTAAKLKTQFPQLQNRLKHAMSIEMEKVVREEKFLKDEPTKIDNALRRCKKLTNTMVTMKKLAMVQDPSIAGGKLSNSTDPPPLPPPPENYRPPINHHLSNGTGGRSSGIVEHHALDTLLEELQTTTVPSANNRLVVENGANDSDTIKRNTKANDLLLVNGAGSENHLRSLSPQSVDDQNKLPQPPIRYSTMERVKYTASDISSLKNQLRPPVPFTQTNALEQQQQHAGGTALSSDEQQKQWMMQSASSSESINSQDGRGAHQPPPAPPPPPPPPPPRNRQELLEQRQQELVHKQRQLHSQFSKLQQLRAPAIID